MFKRKPRPELEALQAVIDKRVTVLHEKSLTPEETKAELDAVERLYTIKDSQQSNRVDPNTVISSTASLAGILMIVSHERAHVIASKGIGFVRKFV